jgi:hypothetical protein
MACTLQTLPAGGDITSNLSPPLTAPLADNAMLDTVGNWIRADLADQVPVANAVGLQQQMLAHHQQLANLVADQHLAAVVADQPKVKSVAKVYPSFFDNLNTAK